MTLRYGYRCDICGEYREAGWTSDLDYIPGYMLSRPEGWMRIRLFVGPDVTVDKDVCSDCGKALREGKPAAPEWFRRTFGDMQAVPYAPSDPPVVSGNREEKE